MPILQGKIVLPLQKNTLFYGDNLKILREYIPSESVDLIYLDPPFNSNRSYNVLFKDESGKETASQIKAFEDTWHWNLQTEQTLHELINTKAGEMLSALCQFIGKNQMTAYLVMMAVRLIELHRVLKPTGSLYLHCDPTASHYLKIVLDCIFNQKNFLNEVIWSYKRWPSTSKMYQSMHDIIFFYSKERGKQVFNVSYESNSESYQKRFKGKTQILDPESKTRKIVIDELSKGLPMRDVWEISIVAGSSKERLGYPTQKPIALLERIIQASSNENDLILDPFCGCGTAIIAAQKLKRKWIGIDITHLSIALQKYRLKDSFNIVEKKDYTVIGEPEDLESARQLATDDRYQFQWWAVSLIKAKPLGGETDSKQGKKGSDKGVDGFVNFVDEASGKIKKVIVQVKSGKVKSGDIRDLIGVIQRENAAIGVFITLEAPTKDMKAESALAGFYFSAGWNKNFPKIQILTIEELLNGQQVQMPPSNLTFKVAPKTEVSSHQQDLI